MTVPVFPLGASIPRVIHQTYPTKQLPAILEDNVRRIRTLNPGWEHKLYDDKDIAEFIDSVYGPRLLAYFHRINEKCGAARADLFRYLLMYRFGGVYLDVKASVDKPLDQVLDADDLYVLSRWRNNKGEEFERWGKHGRLRTNGKNEFQQWHIIAVGGHPFLRAVVDRVLRNIERYNPVRHDTGRAGVWWLTGPIAYTLAITPLLHQYRHRIANGHDELGLRYSILGTTTVPTHKSLFKYHYSDLTEPVIRLAGARQVIWVLFRPIHIHIIRPMERIIHALLRRARHWDFRLM